MKNYRLPLPLFVAGVGSLSPFSHISPKPKGWSNPATAIPEGLYNQFASPLL